jgi:hypothetical protein
MTSEVERRFFTKVRLPNGTYKTTYSNRLDDLNELLLDFLPRDRELAIMDTAVSSGISTIEWDDHLRAHKVLHKMVAGDMVDAWLTSWGTSLALLIDGSGRNPLLLEIGPLTLRMYSEQWIARAMRPVLFPVLRAIAALGRRLGLAAPMTPPTPKRWVHRPIQLVSPELLQRADILVVQDDIAAPDQSLETFDAIRVANLLHRAYFDDETLKKMLSNLRDRLRDGGVLAICRSMEDHTNQATIFRRRGDHFVSEASLNGGVEISDLVLALGSSENVER